MRLTRRDFLKAVGGLGAAMLTSPFLSKVAQAIEQEKKNFPVIWIQGQTDAGCSESILNTVSPTVVDIVTDIISLRFHQTVMASSGHQCINVLHEALKSDEKFILVVEGAVPVKDDGLYCTIGEDEQGKPISFLKWVKDLGEKAMYVVALGTCATWGGIPAAEPNPTDAKPVTAIIDPKKVVNLPGCPARPHHLVGLLAHLKLFGMPELDSKRRPMVFFSRLIHDNCEMRPFFEKGDFAKHFSEKKCMYLLGCKGPITYNDCPNYQWNSGVNWPIRGGSPCIGCAAESFIGSKGNGIYMRLPEAKVPGIPGLKVKADKFGLVVGAATIGGIIAHAIGRATTVKKKNKEKNESQGE